MGRVQAYFIAAQRSEINLFAGLEVMGKRGTAINVVGSATVTGKFELGGGVSISWKPDEDSKLALTGLVRSSNPQNYSAPYLISPGSPGNAGVSIFITYTKGSGGLTPEAAKQRAEGPITNANVFDTYPR